MGFLISVIVPIYNVEPYLDRCIKSILNQSYKNLEIILVNDGSLDRCGEICDEYSTMDNRIRVIHKQNGGLSSARNAGLKQASGEFIGFVDGDDYIDEEMYSILLNNAITSNAKITSVEYKVVLDTNDIIKEDKNNINAYESNNITINTTFLTRDSFLRGLFMHEADTSFCTKLFNSNFIKEYEFAEGILNEDFLLLFEMLKKVEGILIVHRKMYNYVRRENSITRSGYSKTIIDMVTNAQQAYLYTINYYPNLESYAIRFYSYQIMAYLLLIPLEEMNKYNLLYIKSINEIKSLFSQIIINPYLRIKDKIVLIANCIAPIALKRVLVYLNYRKMYNKYSVK